MKRVWVGVFFLSWQTAFSQSVSEFVDGIAPDIIEIRQQIHANPELSNREFETAALITEFLTALDIPVRTGIAHTGVVGTIEGGKPGPVVALRADMDALPVTEATGFDFASTKRAEFEGKEVGVSHAAGHDIHIAVQLGVAQTLVARREELAGTILLIFQPAEEGAPKGESGGASLMLEEGVFSSIRPQAIFALHAFPSLMVGQVGHTIGPAFASSDRFDIVINGAPSHGAWPHLSADPVVMAAQAITAIQNIRARNLDPRVPAVISIGQVNGGERFDIIPQQVQLSGTVRTYNERIQDFVEQRLGEILEGVTKSNNGTFSLDYQRVTPPTVNDRDLSGWALTSLQNTLGVENVLASDAVMGAEDFAFFSREIPGYVFRLGVRAEGVQTGGLHTPNMRADDSSIAVGIKAMTGLVLDFLDANATQTPVSPPAAEPVEDTDTPEQPEAQESS
ncbi:MAG: amidohydrolase [Pseudomonadota bacterium]